MRDAIKNLVWFIRLSLLFKWGLCILVISYASITFSAKKLPVPRFVTTKFDEVNVRTGPDKDCPIEWVFVKKGEPLEIIAEYDQWRKLRDINGEGGWAHSSLLSGNRSVIIISNNIVPLFTSPQDLSSQDNKSIFEVADKSEQRPIVAKLSPGLRCSLEKCKGDWCKISCKSYKGWILRKLLWGIYPEE